MQREFLRNLGIEDAEVINQIMAENGKDINAMKAKIPTDYTDILSERDGLKEQVADLLKQIGPPADDPVQMALREAQSLKDSYQKELVGLRVKEALVKAGFSEDEYSPILESLITSDAESSLAKTEALVNLVKAKTDATEKSVREKLLGGTPNPQGSGQGAPDDTEDALAVSMAKSFGAKYQTK